MNMLRQRRLGDNYSLADSMIKRRRLDRRRRTRITAIRWSTASGKYTYSRPKEGEAAGDGEEEQVAPSSDVVDGEDACNSSKLVMMMAVMSAGGGGGGVDCAMDARQDSSLGSCAAWSVGSLIERLPPTPSPICSSPMSSLSSEICCRSQSCCIISDDGKKMATMTTRESVDGASVRVGLNTIRNPRMHDPLFKNPVPLANRAGAAKHVRSGGKRIPCERRVSYKKTSLQSDGRLQVVGEEGDRGRWRILQHRPLPSLISSDDGYCSGSSNSGNECETSGCSSIVGNGNFMVSPAREGGRNKAIDKLMAWKEARTMKLMDKLKQEEDSIDAWEKMKTTEAKIVMKNLEDKLEKKRGKGMEKMKRKIKGAQREAEKKKAKRREAAARRVMKVKDSFEKMTVPRNNPCRFLFFL